MLVTCVLAGTQRPTPRPRTHTPKARRPVLVTCVLTGAQRPAPRPRTHTPKSTPARRLGRGARPGLPLVLRQLPPAAGDGPELGHAFEPGVRLAENGVECPLVVPEALLEPELHALVVARGRWEPLHATQVDVDRLGVVGNWRLGGHVQNRRCWDLGIRVLVWDALLSVAWHLDFGTCFQRVSFYDDLF